MKFEIKDIKRITKLIMKVECSYYALIKDIANELGCKKTELMQFIDDNQDLFNTIQTSNGLAVDQVFESEEEKPYTDAWVNKKKEEWKSKIYKKTISMLNSSYISVDDNDFQRAAEWRNTPDKIMHLIKTISYDASTSDCLYMPTPSIMLTPEVEDEITAAGYEITSFPF